jgi:hypothetical protein
MKAAITCPELEEQMGMAFFAVAVPVSDTMDTNANVQRLLAAVSAKDENSLYLDKAWDGLSYLMTGRHYDTVTPLGQSIVGGEEIGEDLGTGPVRLLSPDAVQVISAALNALPVEEIAGRYDPDAMDQAQVYPPFWRRDGQIGLNYLLHYYGPLQKFYKHAAQANRAVLLLIA